MNIQNILIQAGDILFKRFFEKNNVCVKEKYHLLSEVDLEINHFISDKLKKEFPTYSIYSEEAEEITTGSSDRWLLDPIDGTTNFIMGNPFFAISLAREKENQIVEGHVYNPISKEYYFADLKSNSAFLNNMVINPSCTVSINESIIAFGYSANMKVINDYYSHWSKLFDECRKGIGWVTPSLSICNVARGKIDAFIDTGCSMEGQAAASFILQKAGGKMFNSSFEPFDYKKKGGIFCSSIISDELRTTFKN